MNVKYSFLILLTLNFSLGFSQNVAEANKGQHEIENILSDFKRQFAPDGRTVYFQYEVKEDHRFLVETSSSEFKTFLRLEEQKKGEQFPVDVKILPGAELEGKEFGVINLSVANLRTKPTHSAEMATQALLGTPVDILKSKSGFFLIRTPDKYLSWVDRYGVTLLSKKELQDWKKSERLIYLNDFGYAYEQADEKSTRVSDILLGDIVKAGNREGSFQEVFFPDGRKAFVEASQLESVDSWKKRIEPNADHIIETAKTMLGVPYLWGGTSIKGVDCSGFTKTTFFMNGLVLPRDASQQVTNGLAVDVMSNGDIDVDKAMKELKKGDLIFFSASKASNPKQPITHVGIYMENGEFIHAAGRVRINSFDKNAANYDSQSETIVGARRYLGNVGEIPVPSITSLQVY